MRTYIKLCRSSDGRRFVYPDDGAEPYDLVAVTRKNKIFTQLALNYVGGFDWTAYDSLGNPVVSYNGPQLLFFFYDFPPYASHSKN